MYYNRSIFKKEDAVMATVVAMNNYSNNANCMSYAEAMSCSFADLLNRGVVRLVLASSAFSIIRRIIKHVALVIHITKKKIDFRIRV